MRIFKQLPSLMNKLNQQSTMNKKKTNNIQVLYKTLFHNNNEHRPPGPLTMSSYTNHMRKNTNHMRK